MSDASQEVRSPTTGFPSYLYTHGSWFLAFGLQTVLFPYLVRVLLQENEIRFGLAQMSMQLPTVLLILLGVPILVVVKAICDRVDDLKPVGELLGA